ncbi:MAG: PQQ-dependent sugar dehydrogenase, partial [Candidatus Thiodiazotropha sp. (ex Notomyrtea botanica)]|nr:PQQ-dependent sugar dehydrogenase [Candidatus Thiodiazotropha sp. (ex Notomyrtea botanica)]
MTIFSLILYLSTQLTQAGTTIQTEKQKLTYEIVTNELSRPWSLAFLPDGRFLVTERDGRLILVDSSGRLETVVIGNIPPIKQHGQGGLLDVALHPDFNKNQWVYLSFAEKGKGGFGTAVARGRLQHNQLQEV